MKHQIMRQGCVAVIKYASKFFLYNRNEWSTDRIKGKGELDLILHHTSTARVRLKSVPMLPKGKGASFLTIFK